MRRPVPARRLCRAPARGGGRGRRGRSVWRQALALWPTWLRKALRSALVGEDIRRVELVLRRHAFCEVEWPVQPFDPFVNVNDAEGLAEAASVLAHWPQD